MRVHSHNSGWSLEVTNNSVAVHNILDSGDIQCGKCTYSTLHCIKPEIRGMPYKMYVECDQVQTYGSYLKKQEYAKCVLVRGFRRK